MVLHMPLYVSASLTLALLGAACSSDRPETASSGAASADMVTVSGCLTSGDSGNVVLTAAPDPASATAGRVATGTRDTYSYVLTGGDNLQSHIGKRVEVTGRLAKNSTQEVEHEAKNESETAGRSKGEDVTPRVSSTEEVKLEIQQLTVNSVRDVAPTCVLNP
ncbi:MAG: hypothetical protein ABR606_05585 [Vicinamibacterales bacterium]